MSKNSKNKFINSVESAVLDSIKVSYLNYFYLIFEGIDCWKWKFENTFGKLFFKINKHFLEQFSRRASKRFGGIKKKKFGNLSFWWRFRARTICWR